MAKDSETPVGPAGGWFGTIGGFIGMYVGWDMTGSWLGVVIGMIVGGYIGLFVEHLVFKILLLAGGLALAILRHELFHHAVDSLNNYN